MKNTSHSCYVCSEWVTRATLSLTPKKRCGERKDFAGLDELFDFLREQADVTLQRDSTQVIDKQKENKNEREKTLTVAAGD